MARAFAGIGDELMLLRGRGFPKHLRHIPGTIAIVDEQSVSLWHELTVSTDESLGGRLLQEGARLGIHAGAHEVVGAGVADIELDGGIKLYQFDEFRFAELAPLDRRLRLQRLGA